MIRRLGMAALCSLGFVASASALAAETSAVKAGPTATALFAGGCFWCIEADFEKLPGVIGAESGYTAGKKPNPTYEQVSAGGTGHTEAVRVTYDPARMSYAQLVDFFWKHIDPTVKDKQFCDTGNQYRSGIYWQNATERMLAESSRDALLSSGQFKEIHTEIIAATTFYPAEDYHQDYYRKNPRLLPQWLRQGCACAATMGDQVDGQAHDFHREMSLEGAAKLTHRGRNLPPPDCYQIATALSHDANAP